VITGLTTAARSVLAAAVLAVPNPGTGSDLPGTVGTGGELILGWIARASLFCAVGALIVIGISMYFSWRHNEEFSFLGKLGKWGVACLLIASASAIVTALTSIEAAA
jgi:hypothetical protein